MRLHTLTQKETESIARLYVRYLYYFHHNNLNARKHSHLECYELAKRLLGYTPSTSVDGRIICFSTISCINCGEIIRTKSLKPFISSCYNCIHPSDDIVETHRHYFIKQLSLDTLSTNPMESLFTELTREIQLTIQHYLLDVETHSMYSKYKA